VFPPELDGDRLKLRALAPGDADDLFAYLQRPEVYEATSADPWTVDAVREFIRTSAEGTAEGRWCRYAIRIGGDQRIAGDVGFGSIDPRNRRAELGYHLSPDFWGQGVMVRAAHALINWALEDRFHRIEATVMEGNRRSERVLEKLGFQREATLRDYKLVRGEWRDFSLWALLEP